MFLGDPQPPPAPQPATETLRWLGTAASVAAAVAASQQWIVVQFARIWNESHAVRGWTLPEGFTCMVASAFTVVLNLLETRSPASRRAVMPGVLAMAAIALLAVAWRWLQGPGTLRNVSAVFTGWFYTALAAALLVALTGGLRLRALRRAGAS